MGGSSCNGGILTNLGHVLAGQLRASNIAGSRQYGGQSPKVVQTLLGHSSQQVTTEIYTHVFPEEFEGLREKLDAIYGEIQHNDHDD